MASKKISRLTVYTTGQTINSNEHNAEHQQYVDNFNELFRSFDYDGNYHYPLADKVKFSFTPLKLEEFVKVAHNADGTVRSDKVIDIELGSISSILNSTHRPDGTIKADKIVAENWAVRDLESFLDVAHNPDGTIKSDGIDDPVLYAHNHDKEAHKEAFEFNIARHNHDPNAHPEIIDIVEKKVGECIYSSFPSFYCDIAVLSSGDFIASTTDQQNYVYSLINSSDGNCISFQGQVGKVEVVNDTLLVYDNKNNLLLLIDSDFNIKRVLTPSNNYSIGAIGTFNNLFVVFGQYYDGDTTHCRIVFLNTDGDIMLVKEIPPVETPRFMRAYANKLIAIGATTFLVLDIDGNYGKKVSSITNRGFKIGEYLDIAFFNKIARFDSELNLVKVVEHNFSTVNLSFNPIVISKNTYGILDWDETLEEVYLDVLSPNIRPQLAYDEAIACILRDSYGWNGCLFVKMEENGSCFTQFGGFFLNRKPIKVLESTFSPSVSNFSISDSSFMFDETDPLTSSIKPIFCEVPLWKAWQ